MDGFDSAIVLAAATGSERPFASSDQLHAQKMAAWVSLPAASPTISGTSCRPSSAISTTSKAEPTIPPKSGG